MKRLGNTPVKTTNFYLDRGKSYAFTLSFVDKADKPLDVTGAVVRIVVEEPKHLGGAEVINTTAFHDDPVNGIVRFQLQAEDLLLEPAEYLYDITYIPAMGYSSPIIKGLFFIGYNTDDDVSNHYTGVDLSSGLVITMHEGATVKICLDYAIGLRGDKGESGEVIVAETITGAPGTDALVEDLAPSDPTRAVLRFTIPRGDPNTSGGGGGVTDHGDLLGLTDDDHPQYLNDARGDARYVNISGDAMSGPLALSGNATQPLEAVPLQQLLDSDEVWVGPDTPPKLQPVWIDTDEPDPIAGPAMAGYYRHDQTMLAQTWVINHNLGYRPAVHVQDAVGNVIYGTIHHLSDSTLTIEFTSPMTGSAHCS